MVAIEVSRTTLAGETSPDVMHALWTLHDAVFAVNLLMVAIALLGLGTASAITGLLGPWVR